jgi:signal transduction histidine kinase
VPPPDPGPEHFDIHASVVFQLGESLISDSVQALVELVKNSYDADASYCKLTINTDPVVDPNSPFTGAVGSITIEDDGVGMTLDEIRRGWLTISNSGKRVFKDESKTTAKGRTPLGDKGLGRLGTQRLGSNVEMFTRTQRDPVAHHLWFSWNDFIGKNRLSEVDIGREEQAPSNGCGTTLIVSQLREPGLWKGDSVRELETNLSQLISPYSAVRDFIVHAVVDGKELQLLEVTEKLRRAAQLRYRLDFDGDLFRIQGKARLSYIKPDHKDLKVAFEQLVEADSGRMFFDFLARTKRTDEFSLEKSSEDGWFVLYSSRKYLDDLSELDIVDGKIANPGPFAGEIDFFNLGIESSSAQTVFSTATEFRKAIGALSGIKVYRDGFGIRVPTDWLNLGKQWTKGGSYYGLKPHNTLGYIAISAAANRQLEETTDREGFKNNVYYRNFYALLSSFVEFSGSAQGFLRRGWIDFLRSHQRAIAKVPDDTKPETLSIKITRDMGRAAQFRSALSQALFRLKKSTDDSRIAFKGLREKGGGNGQLEDFDKVLQDLVDSVQEAERVSGEVQSYLQEVERLQSVGNVLTTQIQTLREQIQQVHEIIGLGLTAEALSHETENITSQLAQRNQQVIRYMRSNSIRDTRIATFTEYVNTSVAGLRRQLSFLAPSLQYAREKREVINMEEFVGEILGHYTTHFSSSPIQVLSKFTKGQHFTIEMNKGKLIQVLDNLLLNSEYWIKEDIRSGRFTLGTIYIVLEKPYIRVSDNGRGVEPSIESSIFEPFVSAKGKGKGRGLGLYIARQLLEAEGCTIRLMPQRNENGRMYCFEIDLTGVLFDKR